MCLREERAKRRHGMAPARIRGHCLTSVMCRWSGRGRRAHRVRPCRLEHVSESNPPSTVRGSSFLTAHTRLPSCWRVAGSMRLALPSSRVLSHSVCICHSHGSRAWTICVEQDSRTPLPLCRACHPRAGPFRPQHWATHATEWCGLRVRFQYVTVVIVQVELC